VADELQKVALHLTKQCIELAHINIKEGAKLCFKGFMVLKNKKIYTTSNTCIFITTKMWYRFSGSSTLSDMSELSHVSVTVMI
jgi:hypothetical protein